MKCDSCGQDAGWECRHCANPTEPGELEAALLAEVAEWLKKRAGYDLGMREAARMLRDGTWRKDSHA